MLYNTALPLGLVGELMELLGLPYLRDIHSVFIGQSNVFLSITTLMFHKSVLFVCTDTTVTGDKADSVGSCEKIANF